jgi:GntR family transcriptional regulator
MTDAKYQQIGNDLRSKIDSGVLKAGARLPSEPELSKTYDASRNTVRLAISMLTNQGLVLTRQGLGTFVMPDAAPIAVMLTREEHWPDHADAALPPASWQVSPPEIARRLVEVVGASATVAAALDIAEDDKVVRRRSYRLAEGRPWSLADSYFPMDLASGTRLEQADRIDEGVIRVLAALGHVQAGYKDEVVSRMPNGPEASFFRLPSGVPVLVVSRTAYDSARPIRLTRYVFAADRNRLANETGEIPVRYRSV